MTTRTRARRSACPVCQKIGLTIFRPDQGKRGFLKRHCRYCEHQEQISGTEYMDRRTLHLDPTALKTGGRVKVRHDAVYDDGVRHRYRHCSGTLYKQIKPKLWIMRLDSRGPIAMHVSNLDVLPTANTNDEEVNHETMA